MAEVAQAAEVSEKSELVVVDMVGVQFQDAVEVAWVAVAEGVLMEASQNQKSQ